MSDHAQVVNREAIWKIAPPTIETWQQAGRDISPRQLKLYPRTPLGR